MRKFMGHPASAVLVLGLALMAPSGAAAQLGATLFDDDFSAGDGAWTTDGGDWQVTPEATYAQSVDTGNARAFAGDAAWADVRVAADVTPTGGDALTAVLGRVQAVDTYYYLTLRFSGLFEINLLNGGSRTLLDQAPFDVQAGTTYRLELHMFGDELTGYVDGQPLVQATDATFAAGPAGLKTFNATAVFDNVLVQEATGPGDEPVDPGDGDDDEPPAETVVQPGDVPMLALQVARQTLPDDDGWGSAGPGTSGGADAAGDQVHIVRSRADLITALGGDNVSNRGNDEPKIVFVEGTINGFADDEGGLLTCDDFADPEYDFEQYIATYDPAVWGYDTDPSGPLEDARDRSRRNQQRHTEIDIGSNTTLIGLPGATLENLTIMLDSVGNVIVRNLTFRDAIDCFPRWRGTDGQFGNWNSEYDNMSIRRGVNFWIDNNTFRTSRDALPQFFGRKYEIYDSQLDITHTSDRVTVSSNVFADHDKMMLIGSTDNPGGGDPGRLNVTLRHNLMDGIGQRAPRMRFGQIDVYNNLYRVAVNSEAFVFGYLWGVGAESQGWFENNYVDLRGSFVDPDQIILNFGGTRMTELGTRVRTGAGIGTPMSLLDAYHAAGNPPLSDVEWVPQLRSESVLPTAAVPGIVGHEAGAGKLAELTGSNAATPAGPPAEEAVWTSVDVDSPSRLANGSATANDTGDAVTITAHGSFSSSDQAFHFVYADVAGDFAIVARLDAVDFGGLTSTSARAGLLFTPDLIPTGNDFLYAGAMVRASGDYRRTQRLTAGSDSGTSSVSVSGDGETYMRLSRTGNDFLAEFSLDGGQSWAAASARTFPDGLPELLHVGLALSSSSDSVGATATFSDVHVFDGGGNVIIGPDRFGSLNQ
jgi:pectate lyase